MSFRGKKENKKKKRRERSSNALFLQVFW